METPDFVKTVFKDGPYAGVARTLTMLAPFASGVFVYVAADWVKFHITEPIVAIQSEIASTHERIDKIIDTNTARDKVIELHTYQLNDNIKSLSGIGADIKDQSKKIDAITDAVSELVGAKHENDRRDALAGQP